MVSKVLFIAFGLLALTFGFILASVISVFHSGNPQSYALTSTPSTTVISEGHTTPQGAYVYNVPQPSGSCSINQSDSANVTIHCYGSDPTNLTASWYIDIYSTGCFACGSSSLYSHAFNDSRFNVSVTLPPIPSGNQYTYDIVATSKFGIASLVQSNSAT